MFAEDIPSPAKVLQLLDEETPPLGRTQSSDKASATMRRKPTLIFKRDRTLSTLESLTLEASSLLKAMVFFEPTDIRERYLTVICSRHSSTKGGPELVLSDYPKTPATLRKAIDELKQERLVSQRENGLGLCLDEKAREETFSQLTEVPEIFDTAFRTAVFVLYTLWPSMTESRGQEPDFSEYAKYNLWGRRDELVAHVRELERLSNGVSEPVRQLCASRRYIMLLTEAAWYYFERAKYLDAEKVAHDALIASTIAVMVPKSTLANMYRMNAAVAFELGEISHAEYHVRQYLLLYYETFPKTDPNAIRTWRYGCPTSDWCRNEKAILDSGLLDAAPDGVDLSPWGFDEVLGFPNLVPFLSLRYFGWMNYADGRFDEAAKCFLQALGERKVAFGFDDRKGPRTGELLYALGNVRNAQGRHKESLKYFKRALAQFEETDKNGSSTAKTHYKLTLHYIESKDWLIAGFHLGQALAYYQHSGNDEEYTPHLARVFLQCARIQAAIDGWDEAERCLFCAIELRERVAPDDLREDRDLDETDFDAEVVIWAR